MVGRRKRNIFSGEMSQSSIYLGFDFSTQQVIKKLYIIFLIFFSLTFYVSRKYLQYSNLTTPAYKCKINHLRLLWINLPCYITVVCQGTC